MSVILMPENLRMKLGERAAKEFFVELLNDTTKNAKADVSETVIDRFEHCLGKVKAELIKWMFVFWIGQIAVIICLMTYIKK